MTSASPYLQSLYDAWAHGQCPYCGTQGVEKMDANEKGAILKLPAGTMRLYRCKKCKQGYYR